MRLISRSTRSLTLTEAGENFYQYCANIVESGKEAFAKMNQLKGEPLGLLKISVPPAVGLHLITPMVSKFSIRYPEVNLNIELENRLVDLIEEGYELVIRSAKLESSNLIAQKIFSIKNIICGTPKYFKKNGCPKQPRDLEKHNFARYSYPKETQQITLNKNHREENVNIYGNF